MGSPLSTLAARGDLPEQEVEADKAGEGESSRQSKAEHSPKGLVSSAQSFTGNIAPVTSQDAITSARVFPNREKIPPIVSTYM